MGFRARESIKRGPGLGLTASKSGLGLSAGTRGGRYSVHLVAASDGNPGTRLGYTAAPSSRLRCPSRMSAREVLIPGTRRNDSASEHRLNVPERADMTPRYSGCGHA